MCFANRGDSRLERETRETRAKFTTWFKLGIVWSSTWLELAQVGSSWLEFDQAQIFAQLEPGFPSFGHLSQLWPSCFVVVRFQYAVVVRQMNGFFRAGSTWQHRLATRRCKF